MKTKRCIIKTLTEDDYYEVKKLYVDKKVREFLGGIVSKEAYDKSFNNMINVNDDSLYWVVKLKGTNEFIGLVSLDTHHDGYSKELSYQFLPCYWGQGYAFEVNKEIISFAFNDLNIKKIISETQGANESSCMLLRKLGMKVVSKIIRFNSEQYIFSIDNIYNE